MSVTLSPLAGAAWQFFDNNGVPLTGGLLYTYAAGTTTPLATYTTISGNVANSNPIVLDSAGRVSNEIWITTGYGYKFILKNSSDAQIASWDNIPSNAASPFANDSSSVAYEQGYTATAGNFIVGQNYLIISIGTTNFVSIGAASNTVGVYFTATGVGSGTGIAQLSRTVQAKLQESLSVKDFGATGNGSTDDTAAINATITAASALVGSQVIFPPGTYLVTSSIILLNKYVSLIGLGYQDTGPCITANFNGFVFDCSGTSSAYQEPFRFSNLNITNSNNGTAVGTAGAIKLAYTGRVLIEDCNIIAQNTGLYLTESISTIVRNVNITGDSGTNPNITYNRGVYGQGRNVNFYGGRVYGCYVCFDIGGNSWNLNGVDCEFSKIVIRQGAMASLLVEACHFETSGMLWTNAVNLPDTTTSPWSNPAGDGIGWNGAVNFTNCLIAFGAVGATNGAGSFAFVLKNQAGYQGAINLIGNSFVFDTASLASISDSFNRTAATNMVAGTKFSSFGNTGFVSPTTIPNDQYTTFIRNDTGTGTSATTYMSRGTIDTLTSTVISLNDPTCYIQVSGGTAIYSYTTVSLNSTYYSRGVNFTGNDFSPTTDNNISLGTSPKRWSVVYAATGTINTSDEREKQDILNLSETEKRVATAVKGLIKSFRFKDAVKEKGESARIHFGVMAQQVATAFKSEGLDPDKYAMFCYDEWKDDETTGITAGNRYGIRYDELLAFVISCL